MGYSDNFLCVKQFWELYDACMAAGNAFENGEGEEIMPNVNRAFDEMKRILEEEGGAGATDLIGPNGTLLTDLSKRNYAQYCSKSQSYVDDPFAVFKDGVETDSTRRNNAFFALQEEVEKFAKYYVRGSRPNTIAEAGSGSTDGVHLNRHDRNRSDVAFGIVFSAGMLLIGVVLLIISAVKNSSDLMMSGLVFIVFAIVLVGLRFIKKQ